MLNLPSWKRVNDLIKQIEDETGVNIKSYDNKYHVNVRFGVAETSKSHKYSDAFIDLLKKVIAGQPYKVDADEIIVAGTGG